MATGSPMVNGDVTHAHGTHGAGTPHVEETLQQMNVLIKENTELKEALKQTNLSMKERFEDLSVWREKQKVERGLLEKNLHEAWAKAHALDAENQQLKKQVMKLEARGQGDGEDMQAKLEALKSQISHLQAEKSELLAMNSELQLKLGQESPEDSFIEIRIAQEGEINMTKGVPIGQEDPHPASSMVQSDMGSRQESEELTVSQLLQSLRKEGQLKEQLHIELQTAQTRITELELKKPVLEAGTQTSLACTPATQVPAVDTQSRGPPEDKAKSTSEVENLKGQMMSLFNELQKAQSKLDEAENMKRNLQDRCRDLEQDVSTLRTQLGEGQQVKSENNRLKVQLESMQAASKLEQRKTQEERTNLNQLKDAYTKLFEDYNELKEENKKHQGSVSREEYSELQSRITATEQALADKQKKIDQMKQEIFHKETELETISVFKAQAEVYSSDFYAERAAREKIHEEKERLAAQLEFVKKQNSQLQEEMDSLGRQSMSEMQRRHVTRGANTGGSSPQHLQGGRADWQHQLSIPQHACPKCGEVLPDLDSLQIHIMDCII